MRSGARPHSACIAALLQLAACSFPNSTKVGNDASLAGDVLAADVLAADGLAVDMLAVDASPADGATDAASPDASVSPDAALHTPVVFSTGFDNAGSIIIDNGEVWWISTTNGSGQIRKCATNAPAPCWGPPSVWFTIPAQFYAPTQLVMDGNTLYIAWSGHPDSPGHPLIGSCPRAGCFNQLTILVTNAVSSSLLDLVLDNDLFYWTDVFASGRIVRCGTSGCNGPSTLVTNTSSPGEIVQDATNVYWIGTDLTADISTCPKSGCNFTASPVATARPRLTSLAAYAGNIYWTELQRVLTCPVTGCVGAPTVISDNGSFPTAIVVDATGVYFADNGAGTINHCPLSGCPGGVAEILASGQAAPNWLAMDANYLFWFNQGTDVIMRMSR